MWRYAGLERTPENLRGLLSDNHPLARLVATCALRREESRGAHRRTDFPDQSPSFELTHTVLGREQVTLTRWS
jgi:aspartate oxidase